MPIYTFRCRATGETKEEVYLSWRDAPQEIVFAGGCCAERVPSVPARAIIVGDQHRELRRLAKDGVVPIEPGMMADQKRAKQDRQRRADERRRKTIAEHLATVSL